MSDEVLFDIQRSLGRIEQKIDSHLTAFNSHVEADKVMAASIKALEIKGAKQRGFFTALNGGVTILTAGVSSIVTFLLHRWLSGSNH